MTDHRADRPLPARPVLLDEEEVRRVVTMDDLIAAMERALAEFSSGAVVQPVRTVLEAGSRDALFGVMPAYLPSGPALGTKLVTVYEANAARGLPTHLATIVLLDPATGALRAIMDGRYITEARTAAVSAVSVRHLARADAAILAIVGSGVQARSHLEAIARVRRLAAVRVWSRTRARVDDFIREMSPRVDVEIVAAPGPQAAVDRADIVALVTAAREPVVRSEWIADGTHVCAVGACRPTQREMDAALVERGRLYVDSRAAALKEAGDIVLAIADGMIDASHIVAELGDVVAGRAPGRTAERDVTIFKSLGLAVEDVAAAHLVLTRTAGGSEG